MNTLTNYTWCKSCGDPCHNKSNICADCEQEEIANKISRYESSRRKFSKFDLLDKEFKETQ